MSAAFYVSYVALWVLFVVQALLLLLMYRHFGILVLGQLDGIQRDGLHIGEVAPAISGVSATGADIRWLPERGGYTLLLFASPACEPCAQILPTLSRLAADPRHPAAFRIASVVSGPQPVAAELAGKFRLDLLCIADDGSKAFDRYRVRVTPFGFVIGPDGRVQSKGLCSDVGRLRDLLKAGGAIDAAALLDQEMDPILRTANSEMGMAR